MMLAGLGLRERTVLGACSAKIADYGGEIVRRNPILAAVAAIISFGIFISDARAVDQTVQHARDEAENGNSTELAVRGFREMPTDAVTYLADAFQPAEVSIPKKGETINELIIARCGDGTPAKAREALAAKLAALNPQHIPEARLEAKIAGGVVLQVPFCTPITTNESVAYFNNASGLEGVVKARYPVATLLTQKKAVELTEICSGKSFQKCSRSFSDGDQITLPYASMWAIGKTKDNAPASEVIARLEEFAPDYKDVFKKNIVTPDQQLQYISLLGENDVADDKCSKDIHASATWPFDKGLVEERFKATLAKYKKKSSGRSLQKAHITVIDSGLGEPLFKDLLEKSFMWINPEEKIGGRDSDHNNIADDLYGIGFDALTSRTTNEFFSFYDDPEYDHGSEVTSLVLGGAALVSDDSWRSPNSPVVVSEVRISGRPQPGAVFPSPVFLPQALNWARDKKADVVNLSLKHPERNVQYYAPLFDRALIVAAAGNDGNDLSTAPERSYPAYAGGMQLDPIITVGAHGEDGLKLKRSNYGSRVDLLAPGCGLLALSSAGQPTDKPVAGTSFAAPLVSFTAGLVKDLGIDRPLEIRNRIIAATDYDRRLAEETWSSRRLNVPKAISLYDDVLEVRVDPKNKRPDEADTVTLFGKLLSAPERSSISDELSRFCNQPKTRQLLNRTNVMKLNVFTDDNGNVRLRYLYDPYDNPERQLLKLECGLNPRENTITFREKIAGSANYYQVRTFLISDVVDLIPAQGD
jgi:hypothetical protein